MLSSEFNLPYNIVYGQNFILISLSPWFQLLRCGDLNLVFAIQSSKLSVSVILDFCSNKTNYLNTCLGLREIITGIHCIITQLQHPL